MVREAGNLIFLDTNIFLQCRELGDLPWEEVFGGKDLLLLVPRAVQKEIDNQKAGGNSRRAKRARKATAFFRRIILSEETKLVLCDSNPLVEIKFSDPSPVKLAFPEILDPSSADDQIIYELLTYKHNHPQALVCLLTHDTNPLLTCKTLGLPFEIIPDDWLLPPEPDANDKRIQKLEQKIKDIQQSSPDIELRSQDQNAQEVSSSNLVVTRYADLSGEEIERLVEEAKTRSPVKTNFDDQKSGASLATDKATMRFDRMLGVRKVFEAPTEDEIERYVSVDYPDWLEKIEKFLSKLPAVVTFPSRHLDITFCLSNIGALPAENLIIEFEAVGGFTIASAKGKERVFEKIGTGFPSPPVPPKGSWVQRKLGVGRFNGGSILGSAMMVAPTLNALGPVRPPKRDRNCFYRKEGEAVGYSKRWVFECDEFRHKVRPESFNLIIFAPLDKKVQSGGVRCLVSAKNLPTPVEMFFPVSVQYLDGDIVEKANDAMNESIIPLDVFDRKRW